MKYRMALAWAKENVNIERIEAENMTETRFSDYIHRNQPVIITNLTHNLR